MKFFFGLLIIASLLFLFQACKSTKSSQAPSNSKAESLLAETIEAHGGKLYETAHYQFEFRKKVYTFKNNGLNYKYSVSSETEGQPMLDVLTNDSFTRTINNQPEILTKEKKDVYGARLNSVIYFATLPHKLLDPAVILDYLGVKEINDQQYQVLQVTFKKDGGGEDHEDQYHYWINDNSKLIDYFAYNYKVSGGGVRFRSAYNLRKVDGIVFNDYINYKAPVGTSLAELPDLYIQNRLVKLSVIATENVVNLAK